MPLLFVVYGIKRLPVCQLGGIFSLPGIICQDANGRCWYLGKDMPVMASAGGAESGTTYTDGNRYTITLQDNSKDYPYEVKTAPSAEADNSYVNLSEIVA